MSDAKHTRAPWQWTGDKPNHLHDHNNWLCGPNEGVLLHGGPWPVSEANARLIAAAPDLLESLQSAMHALRSYQHGPELAKTAADHAEQTIIKAKGGV